jgi:hypothetical protein
MCALPKSGSLHIYYLLSTAFGYDKIEVGFDLKGGRFYYPRMLSAKYVGKNTISHCHEPCNSSFIKIIEELDLKPIVNTRNLLDTLVSRRDRLTKFMPPSALSPDAADKFQHGDTEHQLDVVVELFAHEYITFFTSWETYKGDVLRTTYKEMVADEVGYVERVADWLGCGIILDVEKMVREIKEAGGINFNKGVSGRGRKLFNDRQKAEIRRRADILGCDNEEFLGGL